MKGGISTGTGESCGNMTSDITSTASPTIPAAAAPTRPVAIPIHLRASAGISPRGSPHTPGSSPGGSSISSSPRGSHRRQLHKKSSNGGGSSNSSPLTNNGGSLLSAGNMRPIACENGGGRNAGSTPQTSRKGYSLSTVNTDRYSPNGSPRNTTRTHMPATGTPKRLKQEKEGVIKNTMNIEDSNCDSQALHIQPEKKIRKSSKGMSDAGGGRRGNRLGHTSRNKENTVSINPAGASAKGHGSVSGTNSDITENNRSLNSSDSSELSQSSKLEVLWKDRKIEQGMVRIPTNLLDDLIRKESIDNFYIVEETPVAR